MSDRRLRIRPARAADLAEVRRLFRAYADWLRAGVCLADFEAALAGLPGAYAPPAGGIWLAVERGRALGVVALRPLAEPGACEVKRLYVAPQGRDRGLGRALLGACLEGARARRRKLVYLETLSARKAERLYRAAGFVDSEPYRDERQQGPRLARPTRKREKRPREQVRQSTMPKWTIRIRLSMADARYTRRWPRKKRQMTRPRTSGRMMCSTESTSAKGLRRDPGRF